MGATSGAGTPAPALVARLLRAQAPHLADLPVRPSPGSGSSNWVFRLGDELGVRLPRSDGYADDLRAEVRWLPHLAAHLAPHAVAAVPDVVVAGEPGDDFARPWAVVTWLPGDLPLALDAGQQDRLASSLGAFVRALHAVDTTGAPPPEQGGYRCGEPVTDQIDGWVEEVATELADLLDPAAVREAWRRLREVPPSPDPPCWVHTDLSAENVLVAPDGGLTGVIDFGGLGTGDPAVDLLYAWSLLDAPARDVLRRAADADDATWARARAWAFVGPGLVTMADYRHTMPARVDRLTAMVEAVAAEVGVRLR